jgi:hypothetical protein
MIIVGVLMLVGAGTLLYFFFLRKPAVQAETAVGNADFLDSFNPYNLPGAKIKDTLSDKNAEERPKQSGVSLGSLINKNEPNDKNSR